MLAASAPIPADDQLKELSRYMPESLNLREFAQSLTGTKPTSLCWVAMHPIQQNLKKFARPFTDRLTARRVARKLQSYASRAHAVATTYLPREKPFHCNACEKDVASFYSFGPFTLKCPRCGSTDRERLLIASIQEGLIEPPRLKPRILQFAPNEIGLSRLLSSIGELTRGDIDPSRYGAQTVRIDLMDMKGVGPFDIVVLSHVLEHVPDDIQALHELHRSLADGGQAWIMVPIIYPKTVEAPSDMSLGERDAQLGGSDHVRAYGPDIADRMAVANFRVREIKTSDLHAGTIKRLGLLPDVIFVATAKAQRSDQGAQQN